MDIFDENRTYVLGDPELELLGDRAKLAQWRHKDSGPPYYKIGRKIVYDGADLLAWLQVRRIVPRDQTGISPFNESG